MTRRAVSSNEPTRLGVCLSFNYTGVLILMLSAAFLVPDTFHDRQTLGLVSGTACDRPPRDSRLSRPSHRTQRGQYMYSSSNLLAQYLLHHMRFV